MLESLFVLILVVCSCSLELQLIDNDIYPTAICNDGSPAGYYLHKGSTEKWIIYLEGGGFCYDSISCSLRWRESAHLMSSSNWDALKHGPGILSKDPEINPYWYNASKIDIMYCSSDSHSGNNRNSDLNWSFMGSIIVESVIQDALKNHGLDLAVEVIFSGSSAGGEGVYPNANRVQNMLGDKVKFSVILDSAWFLDYDPLKMGDCEDLFRCTEAEALKRGVIHWNPRMDSKCAEAKAGEIWQCLLGYHAYPFIEAPSFVFVYSFDSIALKHDGIDHLPSSSTEFSYAKEAAANITRTLLETNVNAFFVPSCYFHTVEVNDNWYGLEINGKKYVDVIYQWSLNTLPVKLADTCGGPNCNPTCDVLMTNKF